MGHLVMSDNAATTTTTNSTDGASSPSTEAVCETELQQRLISNGGKSTATTNGFPKSNGQSLVSAADGEINVIQLKHHVDLDKYTKNFKGDKLFGIQFKAPLKWTNIIMISLFHAYFVYSYVLYPINKLNWKTLAFAYFMGGVAGFGVTGGAHRYWTHRAFKANLPLRIILMICFSTSGQNSLYDWIRDHRVHHKYSETDADPHNSNRGFFFAHVGWLMMHKHPEVLRRGRQIDMSDILSDAVVRFHEKYFPILKLMLCFVIPTLIPIYCWGEDPYLSFVMQCVFRYTYSLNFTWSVNSAAHLWGTRPFDKRINPRENVIVSFVAMGEGWHNYHHVFPWDYKAAELGKYTLNVTTMFLDGFAKLGWCWDMKQPSKELINRTLEKYGDGTHPDAQKELDYHHMGEVPDPEFQDDDAESSSTESTKLDENENLSKKPVLA